MKQTQLPRIPASRLKWVIGIVTAVLLAGLLVLSFFQGREEMKREQQREAAIQAPSKIGKSKTGQSVLTFEPKILELSGIQTQTFQSHEGQVLLPETAVIRESGKLWVYIEISPHEFSRAEIQLERTGDHYSRFRILSPIMSQMRIVTTGTQILLSEELKSQIQLGESGGG